MRAWNPGQARVSLQTLPFNPLTLHNDVEARLGAVAEENGWDIRKPVVESGYASRSPSWLEKPAYTTVIRHHRLGNLEEGRDA